MDLIDKEMLAAMEVSGIIPNSTDQQRRLDYLMADGLCSCEISGDRETYRLSLAGKLLLESLRGGGLKGE
jgi:hypothetical protein